ncbi:MAG: amidohydrolase family protein [Pirellulaceae bacterium]
MKNRTTAISLLFVVTLVCRQAVNAAPPTTVHTEGLRQYSATVHLLQNARIVVNSERTIDNADVLIRDGVIQRIGPNLEPPTDARIWNLAGKTIYPGFIDAYSEWNSSDAKVGDAGYWNGKIRPEVRISQHVASKDLGGNAYRQAGFTARLIAPNDGIVKGVSALVSTSDASLADALIRDDVALHVELTLSGRRDRNQYPNSPMGAVAVARQAFYDAQWYADAWQTFRTNSGVAKPETNMALEAMQPFLSGEKPVFFVCRDEQFAIRADQFAKEFNLQAVLVGSGHEYRRSGLIRDTGRSLILPVHFPQPPNVGTPEADRFVSLEALLHWDWAPSNLATMHAAGAPLVITGHGLENPNKIWEALRQAVRRGLPAREALAALTSGPAKLFGVEDQLGSLESGKLAHVVVTDGDLFAAKTKIVETWVDGVRYEVDADEPFLWKGEWDPVAGGKRWQDWTIQIAGDAKKPKVSWVKPDENGDEDDSPEADSVEALDNDDDASTDHDVQKTPKQLRIEWQHVTLQDGFLTGTIDAAKLDESAKGVMRMSAVLLPDAEKTELAITVVAPNGQVTQLNAKRVIDPAADTSDSEDADGEDADGEDADGEKTASEQDQPSYPLVYPLGAFGVERVAEPATMLAFTHATIWTCEEAGVLENATLLIDRGKIVAVGTSVEIPADAQVIDCQGRHLTPGIIDCHSHMATDGGVNESGQAITAEVRIGDFLDANDISIYRQLAGGVTAANILHGSANPIGGQNQVIKLRWGKSFDELRFVEAPPGIKFALGENVKQSNWGDDYRSRYPQTRMGVEQIMRDEFLAARQYRDRWAEWNARRNGLPPRRNLELDAIVEILEQKRWVHCHSYRQDEILALLRTLESFGVQIGTLQHILEGYKVAEVMKQHGAMGSSFSDWWAYKFEVYDAIPYNGALMHRQGVVVSFNSDDQELARHLNQEAAKAVKYGGVAPEEALKFVTLNPAKQLRIDQHVGSLAPGKHADFVIWTGDPLSNLSRCDQTWIDGTKYFDWTVDRQQQKRWDEMRAELIQKILRSDQKMKTPQQQAKDDQDLWPRFDIFCPHCQSGVR